MVSEKYFSCLSCWILDVSWSITQRPPTCMTKQQRTWYGISYRLHIHLTQCSLESHLHRTSLEHHIFLYQHVPPSVHGLRIMYYWAVLSRTTYSLFYILKSDLCLYISSAYHTWLVIIKGVVEQYEKRAKHEFTVLCIPYVYESQLNANLSTLENNVISVSLHKILSLEIYQLYTTLQKA